MLIEISYGSQVAFFGFSWNLAKAELVSCQAGLSLAHCPAVSTSKIIQHSLFLALLFPALTLVSSALSAHFNSARPFSSLLSCGRKFSQLPAKVSLHRRRQRDLAWPSLSAQLQWELVSS